MSVMETPNSSKFPHWSTLRRSLIKPVVVMDNNDAETEKNQQKDNGENKCDLCSISYLTDNELHEHYWSLMHHIKLEQRKRNSIHTCSLCCESCSTLTEYSKHLNADKHRRKVDEDRKNKSTVPESSSKKSFGPSSENDKGPPNTQTGFMSKNGKKNWNNSHAETGTSFNSGSQLDQNVSRLSNNSNIYEYDQNWDWNRDQNQYWQQGHPSANQSWSDWNEMGRSMYSSRQESDLSSMYDNSWQGSYMSFANRRGRNSNQWRGKSSWSAGNARGRERGKSWNTSGDRSFSPHSFQSRFSSNRGLNQSTQNASLNASSRNFSPVNSQSMHENSWELDRSRHSNSNWSVSPSDTHNRPPSRGSNRGIGEKKDKKTPSKTAKIDKGKSFGHRPKSPRQTPGKKETFRYSHKTEGKSDNYRKAHIKSWRGADEEVTPLSNSKNEKQSDSGVNSKISESEKNTSGAKQDNIKAPEKKKAPFTDSSKLAKKYSPSPRAISENRKRTSSVTDAKTSVMSSTLSKTSRGKESDSRSGLNDSNHSTVIARAEAVCKEIREKRLQNKKQIEAALLDSAPEGMNESNNQDLALRDKTDGTFESQLGKSGARLDDALQNPSMIHQEGNLEENPRKDGVRETTSQSLSQFSKHANLPDTLRKQLQKQSGAPKFKLSGKFQRSSSEPYDKDTLIKMVNAPRSRKDQMRLAQMLKSKPQSQRRFNLPLESPVSTDYVKDLDLDDLPEEVRNQITNLIDLDVETGGGQYLPESSDTNMEAILQDNPIQLADLCSPQLVDDLVIPKSTTSSFTPSALSLAPDTAYLTSISEGFKKKPVSTDMVSSPPLDVSVKEPVESVIDASLLRLNAAISDFKKERTDTGVDANIETAVKRKRTSSVVPEETLSEVKKEKSEPKRLKVNYTAPVAPTASFEQSLSSVEVLHTGAKLEEITPNVVLESSPSKNLDAEPARVLGKHILANVTTEPENQLHESDDMDILSPKTMEISDSSLSGTETSPNILDPVPIATNEQGYNCMGKVLEISLKEEGLRKQMLDVDKHIEKCAVIMEKTRIKMDVLKQKKAMLLKEEEELRNRRMQILHGAVQNKGTSESSYSFTTVTPSILDRSEPNLSNPCSSSIEIDLSVIKAEPPDDDHCEPDTSMDFNVSAADSSVGLDDCIERSSSLSVSQLLTQSTNTSVGYSEDFGTKASKKAKDLKLKADNSEEIVTSSTALQVSENARDDQISSEGCRSEPSGNPKSNDDVDGKKVEKIKKKGNKVKSSRSTVKTSTDESHIVASSTNPAEQAIMPYTMQYMGILEEDEGLSLVEKAVNFAEQQHATYLFLEESDFEKQANCSLSDSEVLRTTEKQGDNPMSSSWNTNDSLQETVQDSNYGTLSSSSGLFSGSEVFKKPPSPKLQRLQQQDDSAISHRGKSKTSKTSPSQSPKTRSCKVSLCRITEGSSEENVRDSKSPRKSRKKVSEIYPDPESPVKKKLKTKNQRNRTLSKTDVYEISSDSTDVYDISSDSTVDITDEETGSNLRKSKRKVRTGSSKNQSIVPIGDVINVDSDDGPSSRASSVCSRDQSSQEKKNSKKKMQICPKKAQIVKKALKKRTKSQTTETVDKDKEEKGQTISPDTSTVTTDTSHQFFSHNTPISAMQFFDGKLYAGCQEGVKAFDPKSGEELQFYKTRFTKVLTSLHVTSKLTKVPFIYVAQNEVLTVFNSQSGKKREVSFSGKITCFHEGWNYLYLGLDIGEVKTIDLKTQRLADSLEFSDRAVNSLCSGREGSRQLLCVASSDGLISVRDARSGLLLRTLTVMTGTPVSLQVYNNNLYCGTSKGSVIVFDIQNGEELHRFPDQVGAVYHLMISDGLLYIGGYEHLIRLFDLKSQKFLHLYYGASNGVIISMAVSDNTLFTGTREGKVESVKVDPQTTHRCKFSSCEYRFGCLKHLLHHLMRDHLHPNRPIISCLWDGCPDFISVRYGTEKAYEHFKKHLDL